MQFFFNFSILATRSMTPKIFEYQFFKNFEEKIPKMTLIGPGKSWKEQSQEFWWA